MKFKLIKTKEEYLQSVVYLEQLGDRDDIHENEAIMDEFELVSTLIHLYEKENFPMQMGHPIEIIKLKMDYMGLKRKDLEKMGVASSGVLSEVFNKKRTLSKAMIRKLSKILDIDQDLLNPEYPLEIEHSQGVEITLSPKEMPLRKDFTFIKKKDGILQSFATRTRECGMLLNLNLS